MLQRRSFFILFSPLFIISSVFINTCQFLNLEGSRTFARVILGGLSDDCLWRVRVVVKGLEVIQNPSLRVWIQERAQFLGAGDIEVIDFRDRARILARAVKEGVLTELADGSYYHRSHPEDTARCEIPTHIATDNSAEAGIFNNWMSAKDARQQLEERTKASYKGKKMYVVPFVMWPGSPIEQVGVQVTDSLYGVTNLFELVTLGDVAIGDEALQKLNTAKTENVLRIWHATGDLNNIRRARPEHPEDPEDRLFVAFPKDNEVGLYGSAYGGNLLGPKKFGLRIAQFQAYQNVKEAQDKGKPVPIKTLALAEHAALIELINKQSGQTYRVMLFGPSASGKSTFATYIPPEALKDKWEIRTISDDLVGIWFNEEGYLVGANPENGLFAVAPKTGPKTNARLVEATFGPKTKPGNRSVIFTNTAFNPKTGQVWWEELTDTVPVAAGELKDYERWVKGEIDTAPKSLEGWEDWKGEQISKRPRGKRDEKWAHPNARFTLNKENLGSRSPHWFSGARIDAMFFGGRIPNGQPPLVQLTTPQRAILDGFFMAPEQTAAVEGARVGERRPDPFALRPFYSTTERQHIDTWLYVMEQAARNGKTPAFFHFDQFRKGWPGFREDVRLIELALAMAGKFEGIRVEAVDSPIGRIPTPQAVRPFLEGLNISPETLADMFSYHPEYGQSEALRWTTFLKEIEPKGFRLPDELQALFEELVRQATKP
jgi:phosphoenolpyruvate carboxykinase (GTP)